MSVVYHALKGAETYAKYVADARRSGDEELAAFFEDCREEEVMRARKGKRLLADRLEEEYEDDEGRDEGEDEEEAEAEDEQD